jgi:hypothetical protein
MKSFYTLFFTFLVLLSNSCSDDSVSNSTIDPSQFKLTAKIGGINWQNNQAIKIWQYNNTLTATGEYFDISTNKTDVFTLIIKNPKASDELTILDSNSNCYGFFKNYAFSAQAPNKYIISKQGNLKYSISKDSIFEAEFSFVGFSVLEIDQITLFENCKIKGKLEQSK